MSLTTGLPTLAGSEMAGVPFLREGGDGLIRANQPVRLRLMPVSGGAPRELVRLFGGQGTINVPSWSPDSRQFAFVSYELLPDGER